jgi:hypothetical protein
MKKSFIYYLSLLLIFISCAEEVEKEIPQQDQQSNFKKSGTENLNISILMDLSDRIDTVKYHIPSMEQYERDAAYIQTVADAYVNHLRHKKLRTLNDKISVYFDPEPHNYKINKISDDLKFHVTKHNATLKIFDEIVAAYTAKPRQIYELALRDGKYVGSDTWGFFQNKLKEYCVEEDYRNILVILTDGYIFHKNNKRKEGNQTSYITPQEIRASGLNKANWQEKMEQGEYAFIPATEELESLEILVLGINPDSDNVYEEEVIKAYWEEWLQAMGVTTYEIRGTDLPTNMEKIINEFIMRP